MDQEKHHKQIGLTGGGKDNHMMYLSGIPHHKVPSSKIIEEVVALVEKKAKKSKKLKYKMIPLDKVKKIIDRYETLEKELSSGK